MQQLDLLGVQTQWSTNLPTKIADVPVESEGVRSHKIEYSYTPIIYELAIQM